MPLHIENWNQTSFFDYGSPPLMTISKNIFNSKSISVPQYVVLKWNLDKEGSVYVMLEEPGNLFYFYQLRHPDGPHYKISINHYSVEVCENLKICQKLVDCEKAVRIVLF
jgi:hypothetical protein